MARNWNNRKEELLVRLLHDILPEPVVSDIQRVSEATDVRWSDVVAVDGLAAGRTFGELRDGRGGAKRDSQGPVAMASDVDILLRLSGWTERPSTSLL